MGIQVAKIDVTENPSLSGRFFVTALPTIFHVINGEFRQYRGPRDSQTLEEFVLEKKWKNLETVPWYKNVHIVSFQAIYTCLCISGISIQTRILWEQLLTSSSFHMV